jgi:hypothetical protein
MSGNGAYPNEMDFSHPQIQAFSRAVQATLVSEPEPAATEAMVRRLADEARASFAIASERAQRTPTTPLPSKGRSSVRRRLAIVALAVAALPLLTAGLAVAGVKLPDAADDFFEAIGVDLPNQSSAGSDDPADADQGTGNDGEPAASPAAEPGSDKAVKGDKRRGNGPPDHSNAGGNPNPGSSSSNKPAAPPGQTKPKPSGSGGANSNAGGNGNAVGKDGTPPGQANKPASPGGSGSAGSNGQGTGKPDK